MAGCVERTDHVRFRYLCGLMGLHACQPAVKMEADAAAALTQATFEEAELLTLAAPRSG